MTEFSQINGIVEAAAPILRLCWEMGWNEANGGNFSWRLSPEEFDGDLRRLLSQAAQSDMELQHPQPELDGEYFLVTGSGQFFRRARSHSDEVFGIVRIVEGGHVCRTLWGYSAGGRPTSELATHLAAHVVRRERSGGRERVVLHCHVPEFIALSFLLKLDSDTLTLALWQMMPECFLVFPDGIRVVPPMLPGSTEIADASAKALEESRVISWAHHGIFVSEADPEAAFALVETVEKASGIYRKILSAGGTAAKMDMSMLKELADKLGPGLVVAPNFPRLLS
ncbi:rhamnulose-1-phosphate aldolase [Aliiruegeria sabulilitoris]|uniref:rhamnulose-1-phosphate aldolase n=1 Tax=Aliiruegeria sabulilitoris TaxID=1510458 RepID=UPI0008379277|nr:rhamnulose-1-phosphate aldolase [Aliiruegeria sabulilitoris]NDR58695.1 rhamnulose-1-phosphate aldolase [Pseudoruegeria sp. M32A2M]